MSAAQHTPGPWEYIAGTEHHGPYVAAPFGGDVADCYTMSNPTGISVRNGGDSRPINFQHEEAEANARLIAAAPDMLVALKRLVEWNGKRGFSNPEAPDEIPPAEEQSIEVAEGMAAIAKAEGRQ